MARGECREAVRHCEAALALIPEGLAQERFGQAAIPGSFVRTALAIALGALGRFAEAFGRLREAMHIAEEAGHVYTLLFPLFGLGTLKLDQGDFAGAVAPLERGLDLCRTREVPLLLHDFAWALGAAYHGTGRRAEGVALMEDAARGFAERTVRLAGWAGRVGALGGAYLLDGRLADATRIAQEGLAAARQRGERGVEGQLCDCSATSRPIPTASRSIPRRRTIARPWPWPRSWACARSSPTATSASASSTGARASASRRSEHLTTATTMYREMDMRFWLEQAEAELAELALMLCPRCHTRIAKAAASAEVRGAARGRLRLVRVHQ